MLNNFETLMKPMGMELIRQLLETNGERPKEVGQLLQTNGTMVTTHWDTWLPNVYVIFPFFSIDWLSAKTLFGKDMIMEKSDRKKNNHMFSQNHPNKGSQSDPSPEEHV